MAYATGAPAGTQNLIDTLINWLVSDGGFTLGSTWTFQGTATSIDTSASGTSYTARALARGGEFVTLAWKTSSPDSLYMNTASSISTSLKLYNQAGASSESMQVELGTSPVRYHLFSDGSASHCVVEWLGGVFQHINVGVLTKYGTWSGGLFVTGTCWNRNGFSGGVYYAWDTSWHVRPFDAIGSTQASRSGHARVSYLGQTVANFANVSPAGNLAVGVPLHVRRLIDRSPNAYNGRAALIPIEVLLGLEESLTPSYWRPLGRISNAAYINITNLNPGDTILTDWLVFPLSAKNSGGTVAAGYINSGNYGMTYRK